MSGARLAVKVVVSLSLLRDLHPLHSHQFAWRTSISPPTGTDPITVSPTPTPRGRSRSQAWRHSASRGPSARPRRPRGRSRGLPGRRRGRPRPRRWPTGPSGGPRPCGAPRAGRALQALDGGPVAVGAQSDGQCRHSAAPELAPDGDSAISSRPELAAAERDPVPNREPGTTGSRETASWSSHRLAESMPSWSPSCPGVQLHFD